MGVSLVNTGTGMLTTQFMAEQEIVSDSIFNRDIPIFYGRNKKPLKYTLTLASTTKNFWTFNKRREIARWLSGNSDQPKFCEFYVTDDIDFIDKRWFFLYQGGINFTHNSLNEGYIDIEVINISPYTYSPVNSTNYDFSAIGTTPTSFTFTNNGDLDLYPEFMEITKIGNGDVSILNNSDGGREFKFTGLINNEVLTIDNETRRIDTSLNATYRYDNHNGNFMKFVYGFNTLQITGACQIRFSYRFRFHG